MTTITNNPTPILDFKISGGNAKMPFDISVFEDCLVTETFWTFKSKKQTIFFKDIKMVKVVKNEKGWPQFLNITRKDGTYERFDVGYSQASTQIQEYIASKIA